MDYYDIYFKNNSIGVASVESAGLYTQFQCQCDFCEEGSYRIIAQYGALQIDLGLCVPENNFFVTRAKVATKKLNDQSPYFFVVDGKQCDMTFIPVNPNEDFPYITKLVDAIFLVRKEVKGILINND